MKLLQKFAVGITLIAAIGGLIDLMLAYHKEWWYGGDVDVTSIVGRFWHHDFPVNLTMTKESTPMLKDPAWLSFILGVPAALTALIGLRSVKNDLNSMADNVTSLTESLIKVNDYTLGINVIQQGTNDKEEAGEISKFISTLRNKKSRVYIQLVSGNRIIGTLKEDSPHAILVQTEKGDILIFKRSITSIDAFDFDQHIHDRKD